MKTIIAIVIAAVLVAGCSSTHQVPKPGNIVTRAEWGSTPDPIPDSRRQVPVWVTIHHAGVLWTNKVTPAVFVKNMQEWGKKRPQIEKPPMDTYWPDLPYHYLIAPDGRIFEGRPVEYEPESNTKYLVSGNIGIEMMGDFQKQRPSEAQLRSCVALTAWLCREYHVSVAHIRGHKDAAPGQTTCPGKDFYRYLESGQFRRWVEQTTMGQVADVREGRPLPGGPTVSILDARPPTTAPASR